MLCIGKKPGQGRTSPRGHDIEYFRLCVLDPHLSNGNRKIQMPGGFFQESALLGGRFEERDGNSAAQQFGQDEAGKSRAAAQIRQRARSRRDETTELGGIPEMAIPNVVQRVRRNQAVACIPVGEQLRVGLKTRECFT